MALAIKVEHDSVAFVKAGCVEAEAVRAEVEEVAARGQRGISGELGRKFSVHG